MKNDALINGEVVILPEEQVEAAAAFHRKRIAFIWVDDMLKVNADPNDDRDHQHWVCEDFNLTIEEFERLPRGYIIEGRIQFFIGSNFRPISDEEGESISEADFIYLRKIHMETYPGVGFTVYNGVEVRPVGELWPPIQTLGVYNSLGVPIVE